MKFGRLTINDVFSIGSHTIKRKYLCECDCGNFITSTMGNLTNGQTQSCGCLRREFAKQNGAKSIIDLTGKIFGSLTVISKGPNDTKIANKPKWNCLCKCGNKTLELGDRLRGGYKTECRICSYKRKGNSYRYIAKTPYYIGKQQRRVKINGKSVSIKKLQTEEFEAELKEQLAST